MKARRIILEPGLSLLFVVLAFLVGGTRVWAQEISYVNRTWSGSAIVETPSTCTTYTEISGNNSLEQALTGGWYVVKENASRKRIIIKAGYEVNIILCDGATLNSIVTFEHVGIYDALLHIYGQSGGTGKLVADARNDKKNAGIGANTATSGYERLGTLHVHGGKIEARGGKYAAGIGGAWYLGNNYNGKVYVYGGSIEAYGGKYGAGIGGGQNDDGAGWVVSPTSQANGVQPNDGETLLAANSEYIASGSVSIFARYQPITISLADDASNYETLSKYNGKTAQTVTLAGRELYKDGYWNTLCLPFEASITSGPLAGDGVEAMTLNTSTSNLEGGTLTLNFGDGEANGIVDAEANSSLFTLHSSLSEWYTLNGRRVNRQMVKSSNGQIRKGLYIHNGKKVVIK